MSDSFVFWPTLSPTACLVNSACSRGGLRKVWITSIEETYYFEPRPSHSLALDSCAKDHIYRVSAENREISSGVPLVSPFLASNEVLTNLSSRLALWKRWLQEWWKIMIEKNRNIAAALLPKAIPRLLLGITRALLLSSIIELPWKLLVGFLDSDENEVEAAENVSVGSTGLEVPLWSFAEVTEYNLDV